MKGSPRGRFLLFLTVLITGAGTAAPAAPVYDYTAKFPGVCYSPTHYGQKDNANPRTTLDAFAKDFPLVAGKGFTVVRS